MCLKRKVGKAENLVPKVPEIAFLEGRVPKDELQSCPLESEK